MAGALILGLSDFRNRLTFFENATYHQGSTLPPRAESEEKGTRPVLESPHPMSESRSILLSLLALLLAAPILSCGGQSKAVELAEMEARAGRQEAPQPDTTVIDEEPSLTDEPESILRLLEPHKLDLNEMVDRRLIRVLVTFSRTNFFLDGPRQRGLTADALREFEKFLNTKLGIDRSRPLTVVAIPVARDKLIPYLEEGRGDIAAASLTITAERLETVDFSVPVYQNVKELIVTGPGSPDIVTMEDLAGRRVHVRASSSFRESLESVNESFAARGLAAIEIVPASEYFETEDLLEMVNAGLVPITVADDYRAKFWSQVFSDLFVHDDLAIAEGGEIAWAIRRDADGLKELVDRFVSASRKGTLLGNMLFKRYLQNTDYVKNALADEDRRRFMEMTDLFRRYSDRYEFDYLMVIAQGYQESRLDQSARSGAGAIGVMQLLASTAADKSVAIPDIHILENNVHAGIKYLRHLVETYFDDPDLDDLNRTLFAFAGYNAGPTRIRRLRDRAAERGYDRNVWFGNVELVVAREVGRETVQYVRNIFKYYTVYRLLEDQQTLRKRLKTSAG